ncbi:MAG: glycosyltransferase family 2 protein [Syntrophobacteraceae bacterium]
MSQPDLSIIIVNYNSADYVAACLRSIAKQTSAVSYETILVDNATYDGCEQMLARDYPDAVYIQSDQNLGFARANNLGAYHANGDTLLFLNPDTEVKDRAIERLHTAIQNLESPGAVGCRLLNTDGTLQTSCVQSFPTVLNQLLDADLLRRWFPSSRLWGVVALNSTDVTPAEVEAVSGACIMLRRKVFEQVGGFDPDFFMYGEDLHLCLKARRAGFHNYYVGTAEVMHHGGGSSTKEQSNFSTIMMRDSVSRLLEKSRGLSYSRRYRQTQAAAAVFRLLLLRFLRPAYHARANMVEWRSTFSKWKAVLRWGLGLKNVGILELEARDNLK